MPLLLPAGMSDNQEDVLDYEESEEGEPGPPPTQGEQYQASAHSPLRTPTPPAQQQQPQPEARHTPIVFGLPPARAPFERYLDETAPVVAAVQAAAAEAAAAEAAAVQSDAEASEGAAPAKRQCIAPPALAAAEAAAATAASLPQLEPFGKLQGPVILTDLLEQQRALRHLAEQYMEYSANATVLTEADKQQHSAYEQSSSLQLREAMQKEGLSPPKLRNIMQRPGCPCFCLHHGVGTHYSVDCSVLRMCSTAGRVWQKLLFNSVNNQQQPGRGKMRAAMHGRFGRGPGRGGHPSRGPGRYMGRGPQQVQQHFHPLSLRAFKATTHPWRVHTCLRQQCSLTPHLACPRSGLGQQQLQQAASLVGLAWQRQPLQQAVSSAWVSRQQLALAWHPSGQGCRSSHAPVCLSGWVATCPSCQD